MTRLFFVIAVILLGLSGGGASADTLLESLKNRDYAKAKRLLQVGDIDVNVRNRYGYTPLHLSEDVDVSKRLLELGADPNAAGGGVDPGLRPLKYVNMGKFGTFDMNELKKGDDLSPLHTVKNPEVAKVLITHGAQVNRQATYQVTPLHRAASRKDGLRLVELLLDHGADVNARTNFNKTPLHEAMFYGNQNNGEIIKLLLERGADVNVQDNLGHSALHKIRGGNAALASLLVEQGADVRLRTESGDLPICYAIADNKIELMHFYLIKGDGILSVCSQDRSLYVYAAQEASTATGEALKKATILILQELKKSLDAAE